MTRQSRLTRTVAVVALALVIAALAAHAYALSLEHAARDTTKQAAERLAVAQRAAALEPFNSHIALTLKIVTAEDLLDRGDAASAWKLLNPYAPTTIGDAYFTDTYHAINRQKVLDDARKAHQQHAREKAGGKLDSEDVIP